MLSSLNAWLWQDWFWLPSNNTWAQLEDRDGKVFAHPKDMVAAVPLALALVALRVAFERFVALPLGRRLGVRDPTRRQVKPHPTLEKYFLETGRRPQEEQMAALAAQCGLALRQTQRWFRRRRNLDRPHLSKKFCEASWRFVFYLCSFVGGFAVLYHKPWLWTPAMCWENHPNQVLEPSLYWWYLLELSFYVSLLITLPFDTKRKDFKEQVTHHFVTITLMAFSYASNLLRIGSLVLLLHDTADFLLEACKVFNYLRFSMACNTLFIIFSFVFFYTRLILLPTQILYTTYYDSIRETGPFPGYYLFNTLLVVLQLLHLYWFSLILSMLYSFLKKGQMGRDIRSDAEESDSSEEEQKEQNRPAHGPVATLAEGPRSRTARLTNGHVPAT